MRKEDLQVKCMYKNEIEAEKVLARSFRTFIDRDLAKRGEVKRC